MEQFYYNDQAHIAESFSYADDHTTQTARLAFFKINSYKLAMTHAAFCISREELTEIINNSLLNYTEPGEILVDVGFFEMETEN